MSRFGCSYLILLCLLCVGFGYATVTSPADYVTKNPEENAPLRLHMVPATMVEASKLCDAEGAILASPTTSDMAQMMSTLTVQQDIAHSEYTGSSSMPASETFTSIEGFASIRVPLASIPLSWAAAKGTNGDASYKSCVTVTGAGKQIDVSCDSVLPYFCRKQQIYMCHSKEGYKWEPFTGSCYKVHLNSTTWINALRTCHTEGGHLAIINSRMESRIVKEIFNKYPNSVIIDAIDIDYAFLGFRLWDDGMWGTIHGDSLATAGFEGWRPLEPNNSQQAGVDENCGCIYRDGLFNDCPCTKKYPYICEISS